MSGCTVPARAPRPRPARTCKSPPSCPPKPDVPTAHLRRGQIDRGDRIRRARLSRPNRDRERHCRAKITRCTPVKSSCLPPSRLPVASPAPRRATAAPFKHSEAFSFQVATDDQAETGPLTGTRSSATTGRRASAAGARTGGAFAGRSRRALTRPMADKDLARAQARVHRDDDDKENRHRGHREGAAGAAKSAPTPARACALAGVRPSAPPARARCGMAVARRRTPVASKIALATAAISGLWLVSPAP